jgi:hypothetical protein
MGTAEKMFPDNAKCWSKQNWKRWNLCVKWLAFERELLAHELGRKPTLSEQREHTLKVLAAIWDSEAQQIAEYEQRKAARAAKVVPLRQLDVSEAP